MPDASLGTALKALIGSLIEHAVSLIALASWEGREAGFHFFRLLILLLGSLFLLLVGYLFFLLFVAFFLSRWLLVDWLWIALGIAVVHGTGVVIGLWAFTRSVGKPVFSSTFLEIKKDIETLRPPLK